ncbi:hypothetical protein ACHAPT_002663 [Fusarium lateritium]
MTPARTRKRKSDQGLPVETPAESSASDDSKRQHKLPVRAKDGDSAQSAKPLSAPAKGTMMVFGDDDEDAAVPAPLKPAVQVPEEEEEDESSDDEAPEAVSTAKVASDIKKSTQAAQKAAQEQAAAQKRKRRERDTLFKQQAEERKKVEDEAKVAAPAEDPEPESVQKRQPAKMPNLLPAEFLTDSSSEDEGGAGDQDEAAVARPRKRRVTAVERTLARQDRGPRDERVGSTVYRVAKKVDETMAPKLRKNARSSKELLLRRNRSTTKPRSGFLVR